MRLKTILYMYINMQSFTLQVLIYKNTSRWRFHGLSRIYGTWIYIKSHNNFMENFICLIKRIFSSIWVDKFSISQDSNLYV